MASPPDICPTCGALVPEDAVVCPECGADEETGWNDDVAVQQRLGISDPDDFDHEEWERNEAGAERKRPLAALWWVTAAVLLVAVVVLFVIGRWWR